MLKDSDSDGLKKNTTTTTILANHMIWSLMYTKWHCAAFSGMHTLLPTEMASLSSHSIGEFDVRWILTITKVLYVRLTQCYAVP